MKLTRTTKRASGMTLLELTVVILVLLSLISILFIGARAWKRGSDRAASILTIRNVQQAVRSFSNMNGHNPGDTGVIGATDIFGPGKFLESDPSTSPVGHPAGTGYTWTISNAADIPDIGTLYLTVTGAGTPGDPPANYMPKDYGTPTSEAADW